ncbi:MAG: 4-hydroxy-2-oxovalerate aldolase [Candidatus Lambdaproteobacteria bacterium]|nr:4-hydroxy-2-oxovalerate aldolase [Candidatus Lambdaproteobacteria bacterium]
MMRANHLKARLRAGKSALGCWVFLSGTDSIELLALCGFDAFIIDHEHIGADLRTVVEQLRAAGAGPTSCLVRVPSHDPVYIKRVLDLGVDGLVVPTVESAQQARDIVAATRYRPHGGHRGVGYPESRAAQWGLAEREYPMRYRDELFIAAIVETRKGFEAVESIAAVDGIDLVFLGPGDLAADLIDDFAQLQNFGSYDIPELHRLMAQAEKTLKARKDCWMGGISRKAAGGKKLLERGYHFVTPAADTWLLGDAARAMLRDMRQ